MSGASAAGGGAGGGGVLRLSVGEAYTPLFKRRASLSDGAVAGLLGGVPTLALCLAEPTPGEVAGVRAGAVRLGLAPLMPHGYVWIAAVAGAGDFEAPYTPHLDAEGGRAPPLLARAADEWRLVNLHAVELPGAVALALRVLSVPPPFCAALELLHELALRAGDTFSPSVWARRLSEWTDRNSGPPRRLWHSPDLVARHLCAPHDRAPRSG